MNSARGQIRGGKSRGFDLVYDTRKRVLLAFFIVTFGSAGVLVLIVLEQLASVPGSVQIGAGVLIMIVGVVLGAFLSVVLELPTVSRDFDQIKNKIAEGGITTPEEFGQELADLMVDFFNFTFLDVKHAFVRIGAGPYRYSTDAVNRDTSAEQMQAAWQASRDTEDIQDLGLWVVDGREHRTYAMPIWFGGLHLGVIGLIFERKVLKIFRVFIEGFEDDFVDDQVIHVLKLHKHALLKRFLHTADELSDKISCQEYTRLSEYTQDVLEMLVSETGAEAGLFGTIFEPEPILVGLDSDKAATISPYFQDYIRQKPLEKRLAVYSDPDVPFSVYLRIPIMIVEILGVVILFGSNREEFEEYIENLSELENVKLDNDLENLARQLGLQPRDDAYIAGVRSS